MRLTIDQAQKYTNESPGNDLIQVGEILREVQQYSTVSFSADITADATGGLTVVEMPFAAEVIDVTVQARATNALGTATVTDGTNAISDAIIMAVDTVMARAGTIDDTYSSLSVGDLLTVITNGAADRGLVTITCIRTD